MRIVCPSCAARYEIADEMLAKPRTVRCSRCAREWVQDPIPPVGNDAGTQDAVPLPEPPEPAPVPQAAELPAPGSPAPELQPPEPHVAAPAVPAPAAPFAPAPTRATPAGGAPLLAWVASLLILAALAFAAYTYRAQIQAAWPPSERVFRLLPN